MLQRNITNRPTLDLINKFLKAGYVSLYGLNDCKLETKVGTPQGSILSPLLSNVYMHELDAWFKGVLAKKYNTPKKTPLRDLQYYEAVSK